VPAALQIRALATLEESLAKMVKNLLINPAGKALTLARAPVFARKVATLKKELTRAIGPAAAEIEAQTAAFESAGFPGDLFRQILMLDTLRPAPYLLLIARRTRSTLKDALHTHLLVGEKLGFADVIACLESVRPKNGWEKTFHDHLYHRLAYHQGRLTKEILARRHAGEPLAVVFDRFMAQNRDIGLPLEKRLSDLRLARPIANAIPCWAFKELYARMS
jgi:NAD-specific glutamate dehydrogenase